MTLGGKGTTMAKFIKKPPVVEAVQFHKGEQPEELAPYLGSHIHFSTDKSSMMIKSPHHGPTEAVDGDWIVMDGGALSILKPEAFEAMYAPLEGAKAPDKGPPREAEDKPSQPSKYHMPPPRPAPPPSPAPVEPKEPAFVESE
jgi:hypothetical protein